jgi:type III restriction enzyme
MDRGAHFHACDFQVHTPRDRNWFGADAVSDDERFAFAASLIAACRDKGLDAIAITDHHDMVLAPIIRRAAAEERDTHGVPVPVERQIAVFPGMELTLAVPCQALLIFDANLPDDLFDLVYAALAITPAPREEAKCAEVTRLDVVTLEQIHSLLDRHEFLRKRYIVLPNVSDRGASTLLRTGHANHYRSMPCLGGYLDGDIGQLGEGNRRILSGRDAQYGNKALGIFQTSDSRRADFNSLGAHRTWVKWAAPTAEALRQACLARHSRISQTEPRQPPVSITAISVSNSVFMGNFYLELNEQYNALIGGRGTGKSTILEYLRWALCDEPPARHEDEDADIPAYHRARRNLIENTLRRQRGSVQVNFLKNGVPHVVRRNSESGENLLKVGDGELQPCSDEDVRATLPVQAYSQKQLSHVGIRLDELNRFIHSPVRQQLDEFESRRATLAARIRAQQGHVARARLLRREVQRTERELASIVEQTGALRAGLTGLTAEDQGLLAALPSWESEEQVVKEWLQGLSRIADLLSATRDRVPAPAARAAQRQYFPNLGILDRLEAEINRVYADLRADLEDHKRKVDDLKSDGAAFAVALNEWDTAQRAFRGNYEAAKARSTAHESRLNQLQQLENRARELRDRNTAHRGEIEPLSDAEVRFTDLRNQWRAIHREIADLVEAQCTILTAQSDGQVRASLRRGADVTEVAEKLRTLVSGSGLRSAKIDALCEHLENAADPVTAYEELLGELEMLATRDIHEPDVDWPATPLLTRIGFAQRDIERLSSRLTTDSWLELALVPLRDKPIFEYRTRDGEYISFSDASAGQQATALLWALLNQDGPPLIIDQPEDDLDNQVILSVAERIWAAKEGRQIVFSSHNANIVVNGDADLIIGCANLVAGEHASGTVRVQGAIDVSEVRDEITRVMEGGAEAFQLRKQKYGF